MLDRLLISTVRHLAKQHYLSLHHPITPLMTNFVSSPAQAKIGHYQFEFDLTDALQYEICFGFYERNITRLFSRLLQPGDVFIDIGANVGYYSLLASQLVGEMGQVHAFEPMTQNIQKLQNAIEKNRIINICLNRIAVGAGYG